MDAHIKKILDTKVFHLKVFGHEISRVMVYCTYWHYIHATLRSRDPGGSEGGRCSLFIVPLFSNNRLLTELNLALALATHKHASTPWPPSVR